MSALLDALEQSACSPAAANVLAKSLLRILQLSTEQTIASFKSLNAASRLLKVACVQAQESKRFGSKGPTVEGNSTEVLPSHSMETSLELFMEFFSAADDARSLVLHSSTSVDCLFDLFWEEGLRNSVLKYILELMKVSLLFLLIFAVFFFFFAIRVSS